MSAALEKSVPPQVLFSVEMYRAIYEQGLIPEKSELIEGVIYSKMTKNPIHSDVLRSLFDFIKQKVSLPVLKEDPLTIGNSEPEPDIAIVPEGDYSKEHPKSALLVIEVSNTTLNFDRKKASVYAKGNIPEFLIINLIDYKMEIYRSPKEGIYTEIKILSKEEMFTSKSVEGLQFSLSDFISKDISHL